MNTLHMYHWRDEATLLACLSLLGEGDSLVIYGAIEANDLLNMDKQLSKLTTTSYVVNDDNHPHINTNQINHSEWLQLITKHKNTLTWK